MIAILPDGKENNNNTGTTTTTMTTQLVTLKTNHIYQGNALQVLQTWPDKSVDMFMTSPPYWQQRNYSHSDQLGQEATIDEYVDHLLAIFKEAQRVLKESGSIWVNIGDTYAGDKVGNTNGTGNTGSAKQKEGINEMKIHKKRQKDIRNNSLCLIPEEFAIRMVRDLGFILRSKIIWYKPNALTHSQMDKFTPDYEYLYCFVKSNEPLFYTNIKTKKMTTNKKEVLRKKGVQGIDWDYVEVENPKTGEIEIKPRSFWRSHCYFWNAQFEPFQTDPKTLEQYFKTNYKGEATKDYQTALAQDPSAVKKRTMGSIRRQAPVFGGNKADGYGSAIYSGKEWNITPDTVLLGRQKRSVWLPQSIWRITTANLPEAHFAAYPEELCTLPIKAGCPEFTCNKCGLPRQEIYEEVARIRTRPGTNTGNSKSGTIDDPNATLHKAPISKYREKIVRRFAGLSDCGCNAGFSANGIVADPFFGAGTTGLEALRLGRKFIGIELNPDYIKIAEKRLKPFLEQVRLY